MVIVRSGCRDEPLPVSFMPKVLSAWLGVAVTLRSHAVSSVTVKPAAITAARVCVRADAVGAVRATAASRSLRVFAARLPAS